jgi:predicted metal-binding membrane protein
MTAHAVSPGAESRVVPAVVATGVLGAAAAGWIVLVDRMDAMAMPPATPGGDPGALGWFVVTWVVMTAAMMLPGSAPAIVRAVSGQRSRRAGVAPAAVAFVAAYGAVWLLAGLAGYAGVQGVRALHVSALGWSSAGRYLAAAALIAGGLYQLTGVKRQWLARCVAPEHRLTRSGVEAGVRAGAGHGVCCVTCCWTLMAALYALGIMSITWMVVLTVLIAAERLVPPSRVAVAAVLLVLGVGVAAAPASMPGLTVPATGHAVMGMTR